MVAPPVLMAVLRVSSSGMGPVKSRGGGGSWWREVTLVLRGLYLRDFYNIQTRVIPYNVHLLRIKMGLQSHGFPVVLISQCVQQADDGLNQITPYAGTTAVIFRIDETINARIICEWPKLFPSYPLKWEETERLGLLRRSGAWCKIFGLWEVL